jgi:5-methylcytosine-specific restriction endonuclease McrA
MSRDYLRNRTDMALSAGIDDETLQRVHPYPKEIQLARGTRRYRRKVAGPKQWQALRAEKLDGQPCRICGGQPFHLHHLVSRARGGDDVADNLVPLCVACHDAVTSLYPDACKALAAALTLDESDYLARKITGRHE